jgi:PAS domain S-box-containing protein
MATKKSKAKKTKKGKPALELAARSATLEMQNEELRRAQTEIDASRRKYADLYDFSPVGYFTFDANGLIKEVNHTGAVMLGTQKLLLVSHPIQNFIDPGSRAVFRNHLAEVFRTQIRQACEIILRGKKGALFTAQFQSIVADSGEGTIDACRTAVSDISERSRAEKALHEHERKASALINAADESILMLGLQGDVLAANGTAAWRLGRSADEIIGKKWMDLLSPELVVSRKKRMEQVVRTGGPIRFEDERAGRIFDHSAYPVRDDSGDITAVAIFSRDITERRRAEKALHESWNIAVRDKHRLEAILDTIPSGLIVYDSASSKIILQNKQVLNMCGRPLDAANQELRIQELQVTKPDGSPFLPEELPGMRAIRTGRIVRDVEMLMTRADGSRITVLSNAAPLRDEAEKIIGAVVALNDITQRKQLEEEFGTILRTAMDGFWIVDNEGRFLDVNEAYCSLSGYSRDELLTMTVHDVEAAEKPEDTARHIEKIKASGYDRFETRHKMRGGRIIDMEISVNYLQDGSGRMFVFLRDITARKNAEKLSAGLNNINELIHSTLDFDTIMSSVVSEAAKTLGSETAAISLRTAEGWAVRFVHGLPKDVIGARMNDEEDPHAVLAVKTKKTIAIQDAFHDERVNRGHMKKWGIRSVMVVPLVADNEAVGVLFFNYHKEVFSFQEAHLDFANKLGASVSLAVQNARSLEKVKTELAERRKAEDAVKQANTELAVANRELEAFSYAVSNGLKAPLRVIEGFSRAILEDHATMLTGAAKDYFERINSASLRMSQLIDALLNMARLTTAELREKSVDLSDLAGVIVHELRNKQPERQVEIVIAPGLKARGDTDMLRTVLENILDNAWKLTSRNPTARIEFGATESGGTTVYFVRDNGAGFDMQYAENLFQPFNRLHEESEFPGLGIGLAIAHRIIMRHGGRFWAESEVGKGSTFYFTI